MSGSEGFFFTETFCDDFKNGDFIMRKKITESYFYRIFWSIFTVCLAFVVIMAGITSGAFYGLYRTNLRDQCQTSAEKVRGVMENAAESYREALLTLEKEETVFFFLKEEEEQNASELMRELYMIKNSFSQKASVSVVRLKDRKWISTMDQIMEKSRANFENWGVFRKANGTEDVAVYTTAKDALLNQESRLLMAKACRDVDGTILGYLLVEMPRSTIDEMVMDYSGQYGAKTVIINKNNSVIYHSNGIGQEGLGKGQEYGVDRELTKNTGITDRNFAFCQSATLKLVFLQEIPSGVMSMVMQTIVIAIIPGILIIVLLAVWFSRILAKSVSDPIQEIMKSMNKIKEGDLSVRVNFKRQDEMGQLGRAFDSMTERMEELMERVDEEKHSLWIAETRSLSLQMNPHFLYNTLDLIKWNARLGKNQEIVDITVQLGRVLRRIMNTRTDLVEVEYELGIIQSFVEIQKKHYGDRLNMTIDIEEDILHEQIPKLVIQPIVENAIVHGFAGKADDCLIHLTGKKLLDKLVFWVQDNGQGIEKEELKHILEFKQEGTHHIGLNNVRRRARLFGDESCGITVESEPGKGTRVTLVLKCRA